MTTWAVVLAGGVGSRFWPVSTPRRPKQLLPLVSGQPLLVDALHRLAQIAEPEKTMVLTNAELTDAVLRVAGGIPAENVLAEPRPAGTAAALAWAALQIRRRGGDDDVMLCVHADWAIGNPEAFTDALVRAARVANDAGALVTVGIVPARDDTGFGYVVPGAAHRSGAHRVSRFVEKPPREAAIALRGEGALWNSGIFAWRVGVFLRELAAHTPEVAHALELTDAAEFFAAVEPVSVDVGLLERSANVLVLPGDFGWDDVGTWGALLRTRRSDPAGNAAHGTVHTLDATGNVAWTDGPAVVLYGVSDLVVVSTGGTTLVTTVDRSNDLKKLVESLPQELREKS
ncbi:MAG TPA: sugar phosphate nucleotidyltransferase [Gemmatimonadaceae bacterium]|nr:sugar phosphate nucleotidyltransferase [Gemmatimonadaceae bacterium]